VMRNYISCYKLDIVIILEPLICGKIADKVISRFHCIDSVRFDAIRYSRGI